MDEQHPIRKLTIDLTGQTFSYLTVLGVGEHRDGVLWRCRCVCGAETLVKGAYLKSARIKSCGCKWSERKKRPPMEGAVTRHPLYAIWLSMRNRCENPQHKRYPRYGGRGLRVCASWTGGEVKSEAFLRFVADMGPRPDGMTLDRRDNERGYDCGKCAECAECLARGASPNCRWATYVEQNNNRGDFNVRRDH